MTQEFEGQNEEQDKPVGDDMSGMGDDTHMADADKKDGMTGMGDDDDDDDDMEDDDIDTDDDDDTEGGNTDGTEPEGF